MTDISRRTLLAGSLGLAATACTTAEQEAILGEILGGTATSGYGLTQADAAAGIRAALTNGITFAVQTVGRTNGYFQDGRIQIPLPGTLRDIQSTLSRVGMSGLLDDLQLRLNRGAEKAAPFARDIFVDTITSLSIQDAIGIVRGPSNAATTYLQNRTTPSLIRLFTPPMQNALQDAGALQVFDQLTSQINANPLIPNLGANAKTDLIEHGVEKGLDGLFYYIGREEAAIRANPAKRTSEILRKVFG
jgi:hypothetical protein